MWASIIVGIIGVAYVAAGFINPMVGGKHLFSERIKPIGFGALLIFVGFGSIR